MICKCGGTAIKHGVATRKGKYLQRYQCKCCGTIFTVEEVKKNFKPRVDRDFAENLGNTINWVAGKKK